MIRRWPAACLLLLITTASPAATPGCQFDRLPAGGERLGAWIDKGNWLAVENHRLTLQSAETFMPAWRRPACWIQVRNPPPVFAMRIRESFHFRQPPMPH